MGEAETGPVGVMTSWSSAELERNETGDNGLVDTRRLTSAVRRCLRTRGVSPQDLDDIVNDVMVVLLARSPRLVHFEPEDLIAYARVVARGVAAKQWRRLDSRKRLEQNERALDEPTLQQPSSDLADHLDLRRNLTALNERRPASVEALLLTEIVGLSNEEIASRQGIPVGTMKTRLRKLRKQLRQNLSGPAALRR